MKLATVNYEDNNIIVADVGDGRLLPVTWFVDQLSGASPAAEDMLKLIEHWSDSHAAELHSRLDAARSNSEGLISAKDVTWLPPLTRPGKICGVAMNNSASNDRKIKAPDHPAFFLKPNSCLIGHGADLTVRSYYGSVHPEPELAVVIGGRIRDAEPEEVMSQVFGYTIFNDVTGNGMRAQDMFQYYALYPKKDHPDEVERVEQHLSYAARYKGTDCFGVLGPWITTADAIASPDELAVQCFIGEEKIADDNTSFYNYKVAEVLSFLSYFQTLSAGDVVSMGTAFKPGATRKSIHHANFLKVGGPVSIEIEGLGRQENPVIIEERELGRWRLS
mgnify:CR=1 FL=1